MELRAHIFHENVLIIACYHYNRTDQYDTSLDKRAIKSFIRGEVQESAPQRHKPHLFEGAGGGGADQTLPPVAH
eukprot:15345975-Ditylum_brightwellii.AAC.1